MAAVPVVTCETPSSDGFERVGYLFGYPIAHSLSPLLLNTIFKNLGLNWTYNPYPSTSVPDFLALTKDPKFYGSAVTMPHKVAIFQHVDDFTEEGRDVGACNTVFWRQEGERKLLVGTNTDVVGIREAFYQNIGNPAEVFEGLPGLVIGGGGAARSAVYALKKFMKCKEVYLVNREKSEVDAVIAWCQDHGYGDGLSYVSSATQAHELKGVGAIVACVPDFPPVTETEKEARKIIEVFLAKSHKGAILEMCYHPKIWTSVAELSKVAGWQVIVGTEAMIWQGIEQARIWTGKPLSELPVAQAKEAIAQALAAPH
ncbi:hypothetical protein MBLNU459_g0567t1 [Dothideomycetes sp. NU459]